MYSDGVSFWENLAYVRDIIWLCVSSKSYQLRSRYSRGSNSLVYRNKYTCIRIVIFGFVMFGKCLAGEIGNFVEFSRAWSFMICHVGDEIVN